VIELHKFCEIHAVAHDPHNAQHLMVTLSEAGVNCYGLSPGIVTISTPTKETERVILKGKLNHGGNPVIRWMLSNVSLYRDANDNIRLHKGKSAYKIDGIAALVNAMGAYLNAPAQFKSYLLEENAQPIYV
jgi:phage terminase large subunit-like protein